MERLSEAYTTRSQAGSFGFSEIFQQHNGAVAMNAVVTPH
jgi:hypothetical protein